MYTEVIRHWWNASWGRLSRRDVYIRSDGFAFEVEVRLGGASGKRWLRECATLPAALDEAERHLTTGQPWKDVTGAHQLRRRPAD